MRRCLELAARGSGKTAPNPMVGCVIVHNNRIIGEGYHRLFGGPHAEVMAIGSVQNPSILADSVLYVNLEPCPHFGKTPPCVDLISERKIPLVITGTTDPNPIIAGKGIQILQEKGTQVISDILNKECVHLNRRFFTYHLKKRPYIILKWAQTKDNFIDLKSKNNDEGGITWITDEASRRLVHKWRSEEQAILVGSRTVLKDNPRLTTRNWPGKSPLRIVIDRNGILSGNLHILDGSVETVIFTFKHKKDQRNIKYYKPDRDKDVIPSMLEYLYNENIQSLIVEGGKILIDEFLHQNVWDEVRVFTGNKTFGEGVPAPIMPYEPVNQIEFSESILKVFKNPGSY